MKKKLIAILLALTFALTPAMMVSAAEITATDTSLDGNGSGYGVIPEFVDADIFIVEVPTNRAFDFILDPQGIYGMSKEDVEAMTTVLVGGVPMLSEDGNNPLDDAGQIVFRGSSAPYIINHGNIDTDVSIVFVFEDPNDDVTAQANRTQVNDKDNTVADNTEPDIFIGATFSAASIVATMTSFAPPEEFTGSVTLAVTDAAKTSLLVIDSAEYKDEITVGSAVIDENTDITVKLNAEYVGPSNGTQFFLAGECNPIADWSAIDTDALTISIVYSIDVAGTTAPEVPIAGAVWLYQGTPVVEYLTNGTDGYEYTNEPIPSGGVGFRIGGLITGTPDNAQLIVPAGAAPYEIKIPFDAGHADAFDSIYFNLSTEYSIWMPYDYATKSFTVDIGGWGANSYSFGVWLDASVLGDRDDIPNDHADDAGLYGPFWLTLTIEP